jgi:DNA-binding beta-propeller fold protein YncE
VTLAACGTVSDPVEVPFAGFAGDLLVLADTDMPAFAYANGILKPRIEENDAVYVLSGGLEPRVETRLAASNTVTTWPNAMAVSQDGRFAFVIEGRKGAPEDVDAVDDVQEALPPGDRLTVMSRGSGGLWTRVGEVETAPRPTGIALAPDGRHLVVSTATQGAALEFFELEGGRPVMPVQIDVPVAGGVGPDTGTITAIAWHPREDVLALNMGGDTVGFARLRRGADGAVMGATVEGVVTDVGELLSVLRWSPDGRFLYALDTGWGPRTIDRVLNGPGSIHVIAWDASAPRLIGSVASGRSSENFALSPDGAFLATLNMERTYLPSGFPTGLIRGRSASSVSLFNVDPSTGIPEQMGEAVEFRGVLPQGIAFDRTGHSLAVTVFQDHDANSTTGWVEYFHIEGDGTAARLRPTGHRVATPRGAHDLVLIP